MNKPKTLSLLLLTQLLLVSCSSTYPSRKQAESACDEWKDEGRELAYKTTGSKIYSDKYLAWKRNRDESEIRIDRREFELWYDENSELPALGIKKYIYPEVTKTRWSRRCEPEEDTNQLLGMEWNSVGEELSNKDKNVVKRNFRY